MTFVLVGKRCRRVGFLSILMDDFAFPMAESPQRSLTSPASDSNSLKDRLFDIQDLQAKVLEYQRDNVLLKREIELKEAKLLSCMRSIDLFWSPELKKERKKRQEEEEKVNKMMADLERLKKSKDVRYIWEVELEGRVCTVGVIITSQIYQF